jgi:glycosyltransferase involved in cell wall biosynthesis
LSGSPAGSVRDRDILCLSTQDWGDLWTRKQRFMREFARRGNRVLYVETQASLASLGLLLHDPGRALRWRRGPRAVEPGLHVATLPLVLPFFQASRTVNLVNNALLAPLLRRWMRRLGFRRPVLWTYMPWSAGLVGRLGESFAVYDCVDDHPESRGLVRAGVVRDFEQALVDRVGEVIVTHENLAAARSRPGRPAHVVPNGADVRHFARAGDAETPVPPDLAALPRPVIGFVGSVQYWLDFELVRALALARPAWSFAFVGPVGRLADVGRLEGLPNVAFFGRRPYDEIPSWIKGFDVCLSPYRRDALALSCSPLKLFEYLASGKPVVSVEMPEAARFGGAIGVGRTPEDILARIEEALERRGDADGGECRRRALEAHDWDRLFLSVDAILANGLRRPAR